MSRNAVTASPRANTEGPVAAMLSITAFHGLWFLFDRRQYLSYRFFRQSLTTSIGLCALLCFC